MMLTIELHEEVIKFLRETGTVHWNGDIESFQVNQTYYTPTDVPGLYTTQFIKLYDDN